ncbi:hypothetical protein B0H12DRAFT_411636 [Mycena haematopus]|nr:hypothetical protein B0H12DRAFT_411636 [Mycena haematopus]
MDDSYDTIVVSTRRARPGARQRCRLATPMSDRKVIWIGTSHSRCNAWVDVGANEMIGGKHTTQMIHSARMWSMRHLYRLPPYCFPSSSPSRASALSSQPAPPPSTAKQEVSASYGAWFRWCGSTTTEDVLGHLKACGWALRICSSGGAPEMPYRSWRRWGSARAAGSLVAGQRVPEVGVSAASGWTAGTPSRTCMQRQRPADSDEGACGEAYDVRRLDADEPPLGTEPEPQRECECWLLELDCPCRNTCPQPCDDAVPATSRGRRPPRTLPPPAQTCGLA